MFDVFLLNRDGTPSLTEAHKFQQVFQPEAPWGWQKFVKRSHLELTYTTNGVARFVCGIIVFNDNDMPMPQHDIGIHFGNLLDCTIGSDVSFVVGGETFPAHRAVLAARSPVFKAELFGSMADATMPSITVQDMEPAVFKLMLRFMYTDSFPADTELGDSPTDLLQHLLVAADRYALDRLKLICSLKLTKKKFSQYSWFYFSFCRVIQLSSVEEQVLGFLCCGEKFQGGGVHRWFRNLAAEISIPCC
jgi:speckle-type POZ protein